MSAADEVELLILDDRLSADYRRMHGCMAMIGCL